MGEPVAANLLDEEGRRDLVAKYLGVSHPKSSPAVMGKINHFIFKALIFWQKVKTSDLLN
jgi:hypothetical protein